MRTKVALSILVPAVLLLQVSAAAAVTICGSAYYNHPISWPTTPPLYYSVAGAPPNTCGTLWTSRNHDDYVGGPSWICTDSNGNATKGPWTSAPDDEIAYAYIDWGSCISPLQIHTWDVGPPSATIYSGYPSSFSGAATDEPWGAGFNASWALCRADYRKEPTGTTGTRWWDPATGGYTSSTIIYVECTLQYMPSLNINWTTSSSQRPAVSAHVSGDSYTWRVWVYDGGQWAGEDAFFVY